MPEQTDLVNLTIDGRPVSVPKGTVVWEAARRLGIEIPIYCYHPKMDPLGACRMCFVAVEKMPKLQTACTTVAAEGMVVSTNSPAVQKARRGTLEFLLINHPLDCPICDKGGECTLQDFTLRHGPGASRFDVAKRHFPKPIPVSEHILLDRERCIACQRCVRFCQDVAQEPGLIMKQRGFQTEVGTDPEAPFDSIFSGNVVEMCPVGALTARSYRFAARPWELKRTPSVCANCAVGCNVLVDVRVDKALRQYSRTNDAIDDGWLCDRGRWDLDAVNDPSRLRTPLVRENGALRPATWDAALALVALRLGEIARRDGPNAIGGIGSTHTTNEEAYLFQKLLRAVIGTNNVDHRHGRFPKAAPGTLPWVWTGSIAGLDRAKVIVLLGADPYQRQPVLDLRLRKAIRAGAKVHVLSSEPDRLDRLAAGTLRYAPGQTGTVARALLALLRAEGLAHGDYAAANAAAVTPEDAAALAAEAGADLEQLRAVVRAFAEAPAATILYDERATLEPGGANLAADVLELALLADQFGRPGAGAGPLLEDANSLGARDMGLLPDTLPGYGAVTDGAARERLGTLWSGDLGGAPGLTYDEMLAGGVKTLYVVGANPARHADLAGIEFLVVQDLTLTETAQRADVVLPAVSYAEKDGTFTNTERCIQAVRRALLPLPGAKADWEILRDVARALGAGWDYRSSAAVLAEIGQAAPIYAGVSRAALGDSGLRWPLVPAAAGDGAAVLVGSEHLTWEQLRAGVASAGAPDAPEAAHVGSESR
jgi:NADH-quinone oxidoreductase subunit G